MSAAFIIMHANFMIFVIKKKKKINGITIYIIKLLLYLKNK